MLTMDISILPYSFPSIVCIDRTMLSISVLFFASSHSTRVLKVFDYPFPGTGEGPLSRIEAVAGAGESVPCIATLTENGQ